MSGVPLSFGSRVVLVVVIAGLALFALFAWRVMEFRNQIQQGTSSEIPSAGAVKNVERENAYALGKKGAALNIVEFVDFGCPYSKEASIVVRTLMQKYGDDVRLSFRHFPLTDLHPDAERAAEAAECAGEQGKFWEYHDKLFINQVDQSAAALVLYARQLNLDADAFAACLSSGREATRVRADAAAGAIAGVSGTPTFFFNGVAVPGSIPSDVFESIIKHYVPAS